MAQVLLALATLLAEGCGTAKTSAKDTPGTALDARAAPIAQARAAALRGDRSPARSHPVALLARQTLGPFAARAGDRLVAAWIAGSEGERERDLFAVVLSDDGTQLGQARAVARVPVETNSLVVRAAGGAQGGWLLAWSALMDRGEALTVIALAPDGTPRGAPVDLQRTHDHIRWSSLLPTAAGTLCVWAEETPSGDADILVSGVTADGKPRGVLMRVARGVDRWQAVPAGDGAALALVSANRGEHGPSAASLTWQRLDRDGQPQGAPVLVARGAPMASNVEAAATEGGWLLGWTDRAGQDARVMLAKVDASGLVSGPKVAVEGMGASSLVALASGGKSVALAWEDPRSRTRSTRAIHLGLVSPGLIAPAAAVSLEVAPNGVLEFVPSGMGFALLASAKACSADVGPDACTGPIAPTFLRFGPRLETLQVEPFLVGESYQAAALGWGLSCDGDSRCVALAGTSDVPTPVYAVDLAPRASPFAAPLPRQVPADAPAVVGIATLASRQPYNQVASARVGALTLVAALASAVDMPGRYGRFRGGRISIRSVDNEGKPVLEQTLTSRALAVGGVAAAASGDPQDGAAVAWVARDETGGCVHVANVARPDRPNREVRLTSSKGGASSVAIAWAGDGWLVAWVDGRGGRGGVYAIKIGRDLRRLGRAEHISQAAGDAGDVTLAAQGDLAWIAWSDQRDSPREGVADIFAATVHTRDATIAAEEVRVLATARHSRSPALAPAADGRALLAWIEDAPPGLDAPASAMVACLDANVRLTCTPSELAPAAEGQATTVALAPSSEGVRAVIARSSHAGVSLDALRLGSEGTPLVTPWSLIDLDAPPSFEVALAISGDQLIFDDVGARPGENRVRRALIQWRR